MCDDHPCNDIEFLLREILTHFLMQSEALFRFIGTGGNAVRELLTMTKCVRTCKPGLAFLQNAVLSQCPIATDFSRTFFPTEWYFAFFKPTRHTRKKASGVVGLFLALWAQLVYSHHSTAA